MAYPTICPGWHVRSPLLREFMALPCLGCQRRLATGECLRWWRLCRSTLETPTKSSLATAEASSSSGTFRAAERSVISSAARWVLSGRAALPGPCADCSPDRSQPLISSSLPPKQLENASWQRDGCLIVTCHSDGSHCQWPVSSDTQNPEPLRSSIPYGQCFCVEGLTLSSA